MSYASAFERGAAIVCEEPVAVIYRDGLFYLVDEEFGVTRTMRPSAMLRSFQSAADAIEAYYATFRVPAADVIPFPMPRH